MGEQGSSMLLLRPLRWVGRNVAAAAATDVADTGALLGGRGGTEEEAAAVATAERRVGAETELRVGGEVGVVEGDGVGEVTLRGGTGGAELEAEAEAEWRGERGDVLLSAPSAG